jgi:hypothetical protein
VCGCAGNTLSNSSASKACQGRADKLVKARNKLVILFNLVEDQNLKVQYKQDRTEIDTILVTYAETGVCPSHEVVTTIVNEVDNEYSKYNNP